MAKANAGGADDTLEAGDAPLIDLNDASVKKLIARAKKRGYITYDQLNEALPQAEMSSDQLEDIMSALNEMGVNIVENEDAGEDADADDKEDDEIESVDTAEESAPALRPRQCEPECQNGGDCCGRSELGCNPADGCFAKTPTRRFAIGLHMSCW